MIGASPPTKADLFRDPIEWSRKSLFNIAGASRFSSDATIARYASEIWGLQPVAVDRGLIGGES